MTRPNESRTRHRQSRPRSAAQYLALESVVQADPVPTRITHSGTARALLERELILATGFDDETLTPLYLATKAGRFHVSETRAGHRAAFTQ